MRGLLGLIQWISTALVIFMVIAWYAVGDPSTTTQGLWSVDDLLNDMAVGIAEQDFIQSDQSDFIRQQEDDFAREQEDQDPWWKEAEQAPRPLGEFPKNDGR